VLNISRLTNHNFTNLLDSLFLLNVRCHISYSRHVSVVMLHVSLVFDEIHVSVLKSIMNERKNRNE
jgi:hypothetical protein